jgi:transposase
MSDAFYATDLTDAEWQFLSDLIPAVKPGGRPRTQNMRMVVNAVLYVLRSGCHWRLLPHEYPNWKTVYDYFWKWRQQGLWQAINHTLREQVRAAAGRTAAPSAAILTVTALPADSLRPALWVATVNRRKQPSAAVRAATTAAKNSTDASAMSWSTRKALC